jgi:hypothetical protein
VPALSALGESFAPAHRADPIVALQLGMADAPAGALGDPRSGGAAADAPAPALETADETERWVPSFGFFSGTFAQNAEGTVDTSVIRYRSTTYPVQNPTPTTRILTQPLQTSANNDDLFVTPYVGLSTEMMTPGLQGLPGRPRLFLHGDASVSFSATRFVAKQGIPKEGLAIPPAVRRPYTDGRSRIDVNGQGVTNPNAAQPVDRNGNLVTDGNFVYPTSETIPGPGDAPAATEEGSIEGQGASTTATVNTLVVSAGFGPAFTVPVGERRLRIKPSFEYFREEIEVTGLVTRAIRTNSGRTTSPCQYYLGAFPSTLQSLHCNPDQPNVPNTVRAQFVTPTTELSEKKTKTYYGIGPGLEVEMDTARAGPFMLAVFLSGQAYRMLGDREIEFEATTTLSDPAVNPSPVPANSACGPTPGQCTVSTKWTFHPHAWTYRGGVGVRFRWLPEG